MRKVAAGFLMVAFSAVSAQAGGVFFDATALDLDPATTDVLDVAPGTTAAFNVGVATAGFTFDGVTLVMGSNTSGLQLAFEYDPTFIASTTLPPPAPAPFFIWPSDIAASGNRLTVPPSWTAPLLVGNLRIDTTGMAVDSFFDVFVNGDGEAEIFGSPISSVVAPGNLVEGLNGATRVHIVPEPATLSLLGLGLIGLIRRRLA